MGLKLVSLGFFLGALVSLVSSACAGGAPGEAAVRQGAAPRFETSGALEGRQSFFDLPWPFDLRAGPEGELDWSRFPLADRTPRVEAFRAAAEGLRGAPVVATAYFSFDVPLASRSDSVLEAARADAPILFIELHDDGRAPVLLPWVANTPRPDPYVPTSMLAVSPVPGFSLRPNQRYAVVVRTSLLDDTGAPLAPHPVFRALARGAAPNVSRGAELRRMFLPAYRALDALGVPRDDVVVATVFTTGDPAGRLFDLTESLRARHPVRLSELTYDTTPWVQNEHYCHFTAEGGFPQFQRGVPPFDTDGLFELAPDGLPIAHREERVRLSLVVPRGKMPAGGWPLVLYFHGSGSRARDFVDGADPDQTRDEMARRPAWVLARHGLGVVGAALPLSPDRVDGVRPLSYLNLGNPVTMRDTFRQGVIESRLLLDALETLRLPPASLQACAGLSLPESEAEYRFALGRVSAQGQSMGGMYVNLVGALDPRIKAVVPTGAGGYWSYFALRTPKIPEGSTLLAQQIGARPPLTFTHPALHLIQASWEQVDPLAFAARLARLPLVGHESRHVYQPAGEEDSYFTEDIFDLMALAYRHPLAGPPGWPGALERFALAGLTEPASYPVRANARSEAGQPYTSVTVQYPADGNDGHSIYRRLAAVRWQYGCFHSTFHTTGIAVVPAPEARAICP